MADTSKQSVLEVIGLLTGSEKAIKTARERLGALLDERDALAERVRELEACSRYSSRIEPEKGPTP